jgi:hypothetical protein
LFTRGWFGLFAALITAIALGFLVWLGWKGWRNWRYQRWLAKLPPMERLYRQMLDWLANQGFRKRPADTPLEYAQRSWQYQPANRAAVIAEISEAYVNWRYGNGTPDIGHLKKRLKTIKKRQ